MEESEIEFDGLFSDFDDSDTSSMSSCSTSSMSSYSQSDNQEFTARSVQRASIVERALTSFRRVVSAIQSENISVPDEHAIFGEYIASECRGIENKQILVSLQEEIKNVILETKNSLASGSNKKVNTSGKNDVDRVQAVNKNYTQVIAAKANFQILKNKEDGYNSNEDQEDSNHIDNEEIAKVNNEYIKSEENYESDEVSIKSEYIDSDFGIGDIVKNSRLLNTRLSEDKELNDSSEQRCETSKKGSNICSPGSVIHQSNKFENNSQHTINKLTIHKKASSESKLHKCPDCTKMFLIDTEFFAHLDLHETGVLKRSYECKECGKSFTDKGYFYNKHLKLHTGLKSHKCKICGKCFSMGSYLRMHMLIHDNIKKFKCTICRKLFTQRNHLAMHLRVHRNDKRYKCAICTRRFVAKGNLQQHMLVHVNDKDYCCQYCGKCFKHKNAFKMHLLWHDGTKEYICEICGKESYTQGKLNLHMKTHKVGKHICLECGKNFTRMDFLRSHMVKHIGERNFMCDLCGKCFLYASYLRQHTKSHTHIYKQRNYQYLMQGTYIK